MVNEVMENSLKRNADNCNEEQPDLKLKKLEEAGVSPSDEELSSSEQSSGSDSSAESPPNSQKTNSPPLCIDGAGVQNGSPLLFSFGTPKTNVEELHLTEGKVFEQMMHEFSKSNPLQQISYGRSKYKLVDAYAEFWKTLFSLSKYTTGSEIKLVNSTLDEQTLLAIAKILRRGWEDVRFFPKKLAWPFLEACIFNKESEDVLDFIPALFEQYIEKEDREIIKSNGKTVNEENIKVFEKYSPLQNLISIGETVKSACKKVLAKIMFTNVAKVRCVWTKELVGLLDCKIFKFLRDNEEKKKRNLKFPLGEVQDDPIKYVDVDTIAAHRLWSTFFYGWDDDMKTFYFKLLKRDKFESCTICKSCDIDAKHIVSVKETDEINQKEIHFRMLDKRHDNVLNIIVEKVKIALQCTPDSKLGKENWELLVYTTTVHNYSYYRKEWPQELEMSHTTTVHNYYNYSKVWPQELDMLELHKLFPHIVLYCTSPHKRALIMDLTVSWDHWATYGSLNYPKNVKYSELVQTLIDHGFQAQYYDVKVGARGIWSEDMYHLLDKICGMESCEITKTMEAISKIVIEIAYNSQCKDRN